MYTNDSKSTEHKNIAHTDVSAVLVDRLDKPKVVRRKLLKLLLRNN